MRPFDVRGSVSAESPEPILGHLSLRGGILFPGGTVIGSKGLWDGKCSATPGAIPRGLFIAGDAPRCSSLVTTCPHLFMRLLSRRRWLFLDAFSLELGGLSGTGRV
jgi:hypothetical protein